MAKMPVMFVGHGSPMNAIEENKYVEKWVVEIGQKIEKPKVILSVSAHWVTDDSSVNNQEHPKMIYDMYGFPQELYEVVYNAPGAPATANEVISLLDREVKIDNSWGIDHGTWSVLCRMFPNADIPVLQLSLDYRAPAEAHFQMGKELSALREKDVLILGSGNVVHNLSRVNFGMDDGFPWADEFDTYIKDNIVSRDYGQVIKYHLAGDSAKLAFQTTEHFNPLLYVLGATRPDDKLTVFNDSCTLGSVSMTSYLFE
ncbi:4,5-DOPA dioxygenase extradiol [Eubacteriaceae bacterium ES3]|nr:4,5-DOPA dioxygenase extradiol [Eubacteriaceae bacterium ES3]